MALGFDERLDPSISLGILHIGYALEDAWDGGVVRYDLMTSPPGEAGWKKQLATETVELVSLRLVRNRALAELYRWYDRRQSQLKRMRRKRRDASDHGTGVSTSPVAR